MNCYETKCGNNTNTTSTNGNGIVDLLKRIDKMQKEAFIRNETDTCESCMLTSMYNTKPIALYSSCGRLTCPLGATSDENANLFRVEAVRGNETVVLRLLQNVNGTITCTTYTVVVRIECICGIQCFEPINCETTCYPVIG